MKRTNKHTEKKPHSGGKAPKQVNPVLVSASGIGNRSPFEYIFNYKQEDKYIYFEDIYDIMAMDEKYGVRNEPFYFEQPTKEIRKIKH